MPEATPPPVPAPVLVADRLTDFSDRLSPMLVKELRQGLRARTFVSVFLTLQILLGVVLLASIGASASPQKAGHTISGIIFLFFGMAVLVIQPLRGVGALHTEIKANTLDLMVLTRLNAWRIMLGKWVALVSQSALLLAAIAPYLILRYWFGDMNLLGELILLLIVFFLSAVATAITVGISAIPSIIIRGLLPLGGGLWLAFIVMALSFGNGFEQLVDSCSLQTAGSRWAIFTVIVAGSYLAWSTLGLGASMIATVAENHSTARRLVALVCVALTAVIAFFANLDDGIPSLLLALIAIPAMVIAMTEPFHLLPPVCRPFVNRGLAGRIAGRFLYPGWPSGLLYSLVLAVLVPLVAFGVEPSLLPASHEEIGITMALIGTFLFPAVVFTFIAGRVRQIFTIYLLVLVVSGIFAMILGMIQGAAGSSSGSDVLWLFSWIPPVALMMASMSYRYPQEIVTSVAILSTLIYALILLVQAVRHFPAIQEVEQDAMSSEPPAP